MVKIVNPAKFEQIIIMLTLALRLYFDATTTLVIHIFCNLFYSIFQCIAFAHHLVLWSFFIHTMWTCFPHLVAHSFSLLIVVMYYMSVSWYINKSTNRIIMYFFFTWLLAKIHLMSRNFYIFTDSKFAPAFIIILA